MVKLTVDSAKVMLLEALSTATLSALPLVILGGIGEFLFGLPVVTFRHFVSLVVLVGVSDALTNQLFNWVISPVLIFVLILGLAGGGIELYFDLTSMNASTVFNLILGFGALVAVAGPLQDHSDSGNHDQTVANDSNESMGDDRTITINFDRRSDSDSDPFTEKVDPLVVRSKPVEIASAHQAGGGGDFSYSQLAAIHQYINENISYVRIQVRKTMLLHRKKRSGRALETVTARRFWLHRCSKRSALRLASCCANRSPGIDICSLRCILRVTTVKSRTAVHRSAPLCHSRIGIPFCVLRL